MQAYVDLVLAIFMNTSEIITTSMLLLYTHLRNVAFNTITAVDGKINLFVTKHPTEYARFSSDKHLILNTLTKSTNFFLQPREI